MSNDWLNSLALKKKIGSKAPIIEVDGTSQSRRVSGYLSSSQEVRAYESVICYIQKGLGIYNDIIFAAIKEVLDFQWSAGRKNYFFHQFSFGCEDQKLHHNKKAIHIISHGQREKIIEKLCELAGTDTNNLSSIIPGLYPQVGYIAENQKFRVKTCYIGAHK